MNSRSNTPDSTAPRRGLAWTFSLADLLWVQGCAAVAFAAFWLLFPLGVLTTVLLLLSLGLTWSFLVRQREPICGTIRLAVFCKSLIAVAMAMVNAALAYALLSLLREGILDSLRPLPWNSGWYLVLGSNRYVDKILGALALVGFFVTLRYQPLPFWPDRDLLAWNRTRLAALDRRSANTELEQDGQ